MATTRAPEQDTHAQGARAATGAKNTLRRALRQDYLRPVAEVAKQRFEDDPKLRLAYQLPSGRDDEGLRQVANGCIQRITEPEVQFVSRGLAADFVQRLRPAVDAFQDAIVARGLAVGHRAAAAAGSIDELSRGRDLVRLIDMRLAPRLVNLPDQLAEWRSITRFVRRAVVEGEGGSGTTPVPSRAPVGDGCAAPATIPTGAPTAPPIGSASTITSVSEVTAA